jgi:hypothetical protein
MAITIIDLVTPKAGAKHELLFNKPATITLDETNLKKNVSEKHSSLFWVIVIDTENKFYNIDQPDHQNHFYV